LSTVLKIYHLDKTSYHKVQYQKGMAELVEKSANMLHLKLPTDPRWAGIAGKNLSDILADHAWCEQKAASSCISLIIQYPHLDELVQTLTPIVEEEWSHFKLVMNQIYKRGFSLSAAHKDEYVINLIKRSKRGGSYADQLTDKLLICALIEARSCERFKLLSKELEDPELKEFYYGLMVSEAGHYVTFISLARKFQDRKKVDDRWQEMLQIESEIIANLEVRPDRIH
jgi:tRNA-(ms[2]io[6]A)-hydroxylase